MTKVSANTNRELNQSLENSILNNYLKNFQLHNTSFLTNNKSKKLSSRLSNAKKQKQKSTAENINMLKINKYEISTDFSQIINSNNKSFKEYTKIEFLNNTILPLNANQSFTGESTSITTHSTFLRMYKTTQLFFYDKDIVKSNDEKLEISATNENLLQIFPFFEYMTRVTNKEFHESIKPNEKELTKILERDIHYFIQQYQVDKLSNFLYYMKAIISLFHFFYDLPIFHVYETLTNPNSIKLENILNEDKEHLARYRNATGIIFNNLSDNPDMFKKECDDYRNFIENTTRDIIRKIIDTIDTEYSNVQKAILPMIMSMYQKSPNVPEYAGTYDGVKHSLNRIRKYEIGPHITLDGNNYESIFNVFNIPEKNVTKRKYSIYSFYNHSHETFNIDLAESEDITYLQSIIAKNYDDIINNSFNSITFTIYNDYKIFKQEYTQLNICKYRSEHPESILYSLRIFIIMLRYINYAMATTFKNDSDRFKEFSSVLFNKNVIKSINDVVKNREGELNSDTFSSNFYLEYIFFNGGFSMDITDKYVDKIKYDAPKCFEILKKLSKKNFNFIKLC